MRLTREGLNEDLHCGRHLLLMAFTFFSIFGKVKSENGNPERSQQKPKAKKVEFVKKGGDCL